MDFPMFSYVFLCFSMFFDVFLADFPMDLARKRSPARPREGPELGECASKRAGVNPGFHNWYPQFVDGLFMFI